MRTHITGGGRRTQVSPRLRGRGNFQGLPGASACPPSRPPSRPPPRAREPASAARQHRGVGLASGKLAPRHRFAWGTPARRQRGHRQGERCGRSPRCTLFGHTASPVLPCSQQTPPSHPLPQGDSRHQQTAAASLPPRPPTRGGDGIAPLPLLPTPCSWLRNPLWPHFCL